MKRIIQPVIALAFLCPVTVTSYAQIPTAVKATRQVTKFTLPATPYNRVLQNLTKQSLEKIPAATITLKHNPFGRDFYTNQQTREQFVSLFNQSYPTEANIPSRVDTPKLSPAKAGIKAPSAEKNLLITDILSRENPAEMNTLASKIPDFAQKVTDQDVLFLALTKRYQALDFLAQNGVDFRTVFEQPDMKRTQGIIRPADLVRNMVRELDGTGLLFLTEHGVRLDFVFTKAERAAIREQGGSDYKVLKNFGFNRKDLAKQLADRLIPRENTEDALLIFARESMSSEELNDLRQIAHELAEENLQSYPRLFKTLFARVANDLGYPVRRATYQETIDFLKEIVTKYHVDVNIILELDVNIEGYSVFTNNLMDYWLCVPADVQKELLNLLINEGGMNVNKFLDALVSPWPSTVSLPQLVEADMKPGTYAGAGAYETLRILVEDFGADLTAPVGFPQSVISPGQKIVEGYQVLHSSPDSNVQALLLKHGVRM